MGGMAGSLTSTGAMTGGLAGKDSILKHPSFMNIVGGGTGIAGTGPKKKDNTTSAQGATILSQGTSPTLSSDTGNNDSLS